MSSNKDKTKNNFQKINQIKLKSDHDLSTNFLEKYDHVISIPRKFKYLENRILLIGAPNVGKSTLFNHLTNSVASVSNIDRLTVSTNWGFLKKSKKWVLVDLPGLYNLSHPIDEEIVVADMLMNANWSSISNIIGAPSIERDLYLTLQAAETGKLSSISINMIDEINSSALNANIISKAFGKIPVYKIQASKLSKRHSINVIHEKTCQDKIVTYSEEIEKNINFLSSFLPKLKISRRFLSLMVLEKNQFILDYFRRYYKDEYSKIQKFYKNRYKDWFITEIHNQRSLFIQKLLAKAIDCKGKKTYLKSNLEKQHKFDHIFLKPWIGVPLIILLVVLVYFISFGPYLGGGLQKLLCDDFLNNIVADKWLHSLFYDVFKTGTWFNELIISGVFKGIFTVISFIPPILILFTLINLINQVGLIARISVLFDQTFNKFGLSGRAIVNLMTGFGCNVPSIIMARSSNSKKEKTISIIISPFISCSARAIVSSFICNALFGVAFGWIGVIVLMFLSGFIALSLGWCLSETMFRKQKSFFLIEMVNWRKPDFRVIFKNVWLEIINFIKKAATIIVIANLIIWLLLHLGPKGLVYDENIADSFIGYLGKYVDYIFYPMGGNLSQGWVGNPDGWKMCTSLISAFPAKEIALTNLNLLFPNDTLTPFISSHIPMGVSYLVILTFYLPCLATSVIIKKEGGWKCLGIHLLNSISISYILGLITFWLSYICIFL